MEAMANLGRSGQLLGYSFSPPRSNSGLFRSGDVSSTQSAFPVFVTPVKLSAEPKRRIVVLRPGTKGMKNDVLPSRANISASRPSLAEGAAERPRLVAGFGTSIRDNQCTHYVCQCQRNDQDTDQGEAATNYVEETWGIRIAIAALKFYKSEISPLLPGSCRYVPTCSEYSMQAYRNYGVWKGTVLTAWRIARCNPIGGSGFDPPRWFGEEKPPYTGD